MQIFLDQAQRGRPTHFLRGATLHPPLTVRWLRLQRACCWPLSAHRVWRLLRLLTVEWQSLTVTAVDTQLCDKLVRPCHKHSTRGNNSSLYPFRSSSLSGTVSFTNRSPILWNALQSVSGSEISTFSQSKFKKSFLDLLLVYPKFISFTVGDINSCI